MYPPLLCMKPNQCLQTYHGLEFIMPRNVHMICQSQHRPANKTQFSYLAIQLQGFKTIYSPFVSAGRLKKDIGKKGSRWRRPCFKYQFKKLQLNIEWEKEKNICMWKMWPISEFPWVEFTCASTSAPCWNA